MKLRNKKTGEIIEKYPGKFVINSGEQIRQYDSLAGLNAEWEDYEEQKGYWYINEFGTATEITHTRENIYDKSRKNFGNYFETKEEAEKAAEKLKAWKRLKDKGFRFDNWDLDADDEDVNVLLRSDKYKGNQVYALEEDLDLLFSLEDK